MRIISSTSWMISRWLCRYISASSSMAPPVVSFVVRLVQEFVKSSSVAPSMTWKKMRTPALAPSWETKKVKFRKPTAAAALKSFFGLSTVSWMMPVKSVKSASGLCDGGDARKSDDPPFVDVLDGDENVQGRCGPCVKKIRGICIRARLGDCHCTTP